MSLPVPVPIVCIIIFQCLVISIEMPGSATIQYIANTTQEQTIANLLLCHLADVQDNLVITDYSGSFF